MTNEEFDKQYSRLNKAQKEAVDAIEGPVMVIAGPGTGKTTILTLRIANILKQTDTPPSGILALTFTEAGAKTMKAKLRGIIGSRAEEVRIHTFHGFASSIIREFEDHFPHLSRSVQLTEVESELLIKKILTDTKFGKLRPVGEPDFYVGKILHTISDAKKEAWTPEMLADFAKTEIERIKNDENSLSTRGATKGMLKGDALKRIEKCERTILFADVYKTYEEIKVKERKMDFDDQIFELLRALRTDKLLLQILQEKFLYILVDEHQDTNDAQNLIVRSLADFFENPNLFVVGDEKQAIYRFQGASVANFLSFQEIWKGMRVISLTENYRSGQSILDASYQMIEQNYNEDELKDLRIKLNAGGKNDPNPVEVSAVENTESEEGWLVEKIKIIRDKDEEKTIAVITRGNRDVSKLLGILEANNIEAKAERGTDIFAHPLGRIYFSLLEYLINPENVESLAETIAHGLWDLDFKKQTELIKIIRSGNSEEVEKEIPLLNKLRSELVTSGVLEYLILVADTSGFTKLAELTPTGSEIWRGIYSLGCELAKNTDLEDPRTLIEALLAYKSSAEKRLIKIKLGNPNAKVTIMTAHGSKGLEFDYVFIPFATEENWFSKNRSTFFILPREKEGEDDIRDERRLFYVAITRAKTEVFISFAESDETGKMLLPLRFIGELHPEHLRHVKLEKMEGGKVKRSLGSLDKRRDLEKIEYAKNILLEKGLSVTALNHFLECPQKFFYKSILKLPEPPTASSEKGTAMHEALSNVWKKNLTPSPPSDQVIRAGSPRVRRGEEDIETIIKESVTQFFQKSLLNKVEKEAVLKELLKNAPKVAECLVDHFNTEGQVRTESWVETPFLFESEEISLHGKLDTVIEPDSAKATTGKQEILVFDYKTKEGMSENAIRGETKTDSDGNYFRQLVFYKILIDRSRGTNPQNISKDVITSLVFVKPDSKGRCPIITLEVTKADVEKVETEIKSLLTSVWSGDFLNSTCEDKNCEYCSYRKLAL